jgi:hypothetical protein
MQEKLENIINLLIRALETPHSNHIYIVTFMCLKIDISFIFTKKKMFQNVFLISAMVTWHSGVKNHDIRTFKVNFVC